jgi:hypothetical protein
MSTYNVDYDAHYFIPLELITTAIPFDDGHGFTTPSGNLILAECKISEGMYGKVSATPLYYEDGLYFCKCKNSFYICRPENFYADDFNSLLKRGVIIKKESKTQHVEIVEKWEPLTNNTHIVHSRYTVVE